MAIVKPPVRAAWADTATSSDIVDPGVTYTAGGWPLVNQPPPRQYFNWILNYCMNGIRYLCRRGMADWDTIETYQIGDIVRSDDSLLRQSLIANNTGNAPSTNSADWSSVKVPTPARGVIDTSIASMGAIANAIYTFQAAFTTVPIVYYKLATLPVSNNGTYDSMQIRATINYGFSASLSAMVDIIAGNRNGFSYFWNNFGDAPGTDNLGIFFYQNANGTTDLYLLGVAYGYINLSIINSTQSQITYYANPIAVAAPTGGTVVFSTTTPGTYPPLLNINAVGGGLLTSAVAAATYETLTDAALKLTSAAAASTYLSQGSAAATYETIAAAGTAATAANTYAAGQASAAQAAAIASASIDAANKATAAQTTAESYAASQASLAATNAENYTISYVGTAIAPLAPLASPTFTGTPRSTTSPTSGDSSNKVATTSFVNPNSSIALNGYETSASGRIMQWGAAPSTGTSPQTVTFPLTFPNGIFSIVATPVVPGGVETFDIATYSVSGFTANSASGTSFFWLAIGH